MRIPQTIIATSTRRVCTVQSQNMAQYIPSIPPSIKKLPISALPLPAISQSLIYNLTPDPTATTPAEFQALQSTRPSSQRRARLLDQQVHFSFISPCPLPFPYEVSPPADGEPVTDKTAYIETWLAEREPLIEHPSAPSPVKGTLKKYISKQESQPRELLGLSEGALQNYLPHLDVGDAFELLGTPTLAHSAKASDTLPKPSEHDAAVRQELIDVLSGCAALLSVDSDAQTAWAPWSLRYSGHQFGNWAGQLGDGRAISLLVTPHPADSTRICEIQLKGAGRTPFSRTADGLAVTRSSVREFLCSEAMHALGIPTTRALSLVSLPALPVVRERTESACVLARLAPSFIRIGSFEAFNAPQGMFFFGGGQQEPGWEGLRVLGEWVAGRVLGIWDRAGEGAGEDAGDLKAWGKELVLEVARRNARMVAAWQVYGFMHGVINTDNVSVLGLTIDYGPFAFMDVFDPWHICNHTDEEGRYSYKRQPAMIVYALRALATALAPLIGAEAARNNTAVRRGWADGASAEQIAQWTETGKKAVMDELEQVSQTECAEEYGRLMRKRLALRRQDPSDEAQLSRPLLDLLASHRLDFHGTFRTLSTFRPSISANASHQDAFVARLLTHASDPDKLDRAQAEREWHEWLQRYALRIESERAEWGAGVETGWEVAREKAAREANPRFVLRQWVLEEVIRKVEEDAVSGRRVLRKVLQMACSPFEPWGAEDLADDQIELDEEVREERRFCGIGNKQMLGFQCSCSS